MKCQFLQIGLLLEAEEGLQRVSLLAQIDFMPLQKEVSLIRILLSAVAFSDSDQHSLQHRRSGLLLEKCLFYHLVKCAHSFRCCYMSYESQSNYPGQGFHCQQNAYQSPLRPRLCTQGVSYECRAKALALMKANPTFCVKIWPHARISATKLHSRYAGLKKFGNCLKL